MSDIIRQWIQDRLGLLLNMGPELFAESTNDGYLLSQILRSYDLITEEQLGMVQKSDKSEICLGNFKTYIGGWLNQIGVSITDDELFEITNAKGTAALNLFYRVYLELGAKDSLHFVSQQRLNQKLRPKSKFTVKEVKESLTDKLPSCNQYSAPLNDAYDIIHWRQDRLEMLLNKCKDARQEYLRYVRAQQNRESVQNLSTNIIKVETEESNEWEIEDFPAETVDLTYEELLEQQRHAKEIANFAPGSEDTKRIMRRLRHKQKQNEENMVFKEELQRELLAEFWKHIDAEEDDCFNKNIIEVLLKQSLYEKQMVQKLLDVKTQKAIMLENRQLVDNAIAKQKEQDFVENLILKEKDLDEEEFTYYLEKERVLELHRKIYEERLRLKAKRHYEMCLDAVKDMVTATMKEIEYKEQFGEEPTRRVRDNWKKMFVAAVPFDDLVTPLERIVQEPEELPEDMEQIIHLEIERQEKIDKEELVSYLNYEWPWEMTSIEVEEEYLEEMTRGLNALGNAVHNLLLVMYPYPPLPHKPDFPNITITACINGLTDTTCLPLLQKILLQRDVLVVEIQDAVNYCINAYKVESKVEIEGAGDVEEKTKGKDKKGKDKKGKDKKEKGKGKEKPKKGDKSNKSSKKEKKGAAPEVVKIEKVDKYLQTPRYYPCEEIPFTPQAELGQTAQEVLSSGQTLTNYILVAMFVEYLKSKPDIKGWVLINYPTTYEEAAILEEFLTGLPVPGKHTVEKCVSIFEIAELEDKYPERVVDQNENLRKSKLLPNPVEKKEPEFYDTALTAYIKAIRRDDETDGLDTPPIYEDLVTNAEPLDRFYSDLGCNYSFYYQKIDFNSTKYLAKLIIGDYSIPMKTSVELFGDSIKYVSADRGGGKGGAKAAKMGEKKEKPKEKSSKAKSEPADEGKSGKTDKKGGKDKKGKDKKGTGKGAVVVIVHEDKATQAPEEEEEVVEEPPTPVEPPKAGEPDWVYSNFPFPEELQLALAKFWENAEEVYTVDLNQVFFLKRIILNAIMPFVNCIKEHMGMFITRPDDKQVYLRDFQKIYNEFDDDFRSDEEFKAELHCRIDEMQEKLLEICDRRMMEAEEERCILIGKNWTPKQFIELVNNYISGFQLEIDRLVDSLLLLGDYYTAVVTKMPNDAVIEKEKLPKLDLEDPMIAQAVNDLLQYVQESEEQVLHKLVEDIVAQALEFVEKTQNTAAGIFKKIKDLFAPETGKGKKKPPKPKKDKKGKADILRLFEPEEIIRQSADQIMQEWTIAIQGEADRAILRLTLLKADLFMNLEEVFNTVQTTFHDIFNDIRNRYDKEVDSVRKACRVLSRAVEEEVPIQEELFLREDDFFIDLESILFPDKIPATKPLSEYDKAGVFTITQLSKIVDILLDLSPSGYIAERSFCYLLQDLIVSDDEPPLVPELWRRLWPKSVNKLSKELFDDIEYVQWKDFVLYNLMVPFPTVDDLMDMRKEFRVRDDDYNELVNDYQYTELKFWYEQIEEDEFRVKLMRELIYKLYRVRGDKFNYTAMMMDLCKDYEPVVGLAKALGVSLGKAVCYDNYIGEQFAKESLNRRRIHDELVRQRDEEMRENKEMAEEILDQLIDHTVHVCDSVVIEDLNPPQSIHSIMEENFEEEQIEEEILGEEETIEEESSFGFTNIEVCFEPEAAPPLAYFLPFDVLITVLTTLLPWHAKAQNIEDKSLREIVEEIYEECRNPEFNLEVLSHEFLNHPKFLALLSMMSKFSIKNPVQIVEDLVMDQENETCYL